MCLISKAQRYARVDFRPVGILAFTGFLILQTFSTMTGIS